MLDFIRGLFNPLKSFDVTLSSEATWLIKQLRNRSNEKTDSAVVRRAVRVYEHAVLGSEKREYLFSMRFGRRALPVHVINPRQLVQLPPEARQEQEKYGAMMLAEGKARARFEEMMRITKAEDASAVIENALFLYYNLLQQKDRGDVFFVRDPETSDLKPVRLFKEADE